MYFYLKIIQQFCVDDKNRLFYLRPDNSNACISQRLKCRYRYHHGPKSCWYQIELTLPYRMLFVSIGCIDGDVYDQDCTRLGPSLYIAFLQPFYSRFIAALWLRILLVLFPSYFGVVVLWLIYLSCKGKGKIIRCILRILPSIETILSNVSIKRRYRSGSRHSDKSLF